MVRDQFAQLAQGTGLTKAELANYLGCDLSTLYRWLRAEPTPRRAVVEAVQNLATRRQNVAPSSSKKFRFIDLFAGIGGMRLGVQAAGGRCVYSCEWNEHSRATYARNFEDGPDHLFERDITQIDLNKIPDHDLLVAGFPCQPFSIAGVSKKNALGKPHGFDCQEQGNLFFDLVKILRARKPAAFLLENVKNLRSHDGGNTFRVIEHYLRNELHYHIDSRVINAKGFVPQNRERIFIVGFRQDVGFNFSGLAVPAPDRGPKLVDILHPEDGTEEPEEPYTHGPTAAVNPKYVLSAHLWQYLRNYQAKHEAMGHGFGFGLVGPADTARTLSARYFKDGSEILIKRGSRQRPRRLTPRECARLMGFDSTQDGRRFKIQPTSDTQAYKQFGNAVVVPVVAAVARYVTPFLLKAMRSSEAHQLELVLDTVAAREIISA